MILDTFPELSKAFGRSHTTMAVSMLLSVLMNCLLTQMITGASTSTKKSFTLRVTWKHQACK